MIGDDLLKTLNYGIRLCVIYTSCFSSPSLEHDILTCLVTRLKNMRCEISIIDVNSDDKEPARIMSHILHSPGHGKSALDSSKNILIAQLSICILTFPNEIIDVFFIFYDLFLLLF